MQGLADKRRTLVVRSGLIAMAFVFMQVALDGEVHGNEVPTPIYSFDIGGGAIFPDPYTTTVQVNFDPTASLPDVPVANRFYRMVWEFNVPYNGRLPNPELVITQCDGSPLPDLGVPPTLVVASGPNAVLETEPDQNDLLSNPPGQPPEIHTGDDLLPNTRVNLNIVVKPGTDGVLQTSPSGDDVLGTDTNPTSPTFGQPVILAGDDAIADSYALPGICIRAGPTGVIAAMPQGDDILAPGGDPETGHDVIIDGGDELCNTQADVINGQDVQWVGLGVRPSDDAQVASVGAIVGTTNIVVLPGPNGVLDTAPLGDDKLSTDVAGAPCITVGENLFANTRAVGDDVQVLSVGQMQPTTVKPLTAPTVQAITMVIAPGPNGQIDSPVVGDDILTLDSLNRPVVVVGDNLTAESLAIPVVTDDIQVLPVGASVPPYLVPPDTTNYNYGWRFTDDIQVADPDGLINNTNPGIDTGYTTLTDAKALQCVQYSWDTIQPPNEIDQVVAVRLRFYIADDANGTNAVETTFVRLLHLSLPNFQSVVNAELGASQSDNIDPGTAVSISLADTWDQDGYPLWGAVDWGDGNVTILTEAQLAQLPELLPDLQHPAGGYAAPGIYGITVSIIDNGRLTLADRPGFRLFQADPNETDPDVVLDEAIAYQVANPPPNTLEDPNKPGSMVDLLGNRIDPILMQNFIFIRVLGGFSTRTGRFNSALALVGRDTLTLKLQATSPLTFTPGDVATITLSHPTSGAATPIGSGALSRRGSFKDPATGLRFRFNQRTGLMIFRINRSDLKNLFQVYRQTGTTVASTTTEIQNGYAEVVVLVSGLSGGTPVGTVRFVYNSNTKKGKGSKPKSLNDPG